MHAENLVVDQCSDWHAVENVLEFLPHAYGVATLALIIESVDTVDLSTLVVTSKKEEILLKLDFVCQEQNDGLERVLASVDVVAQKEVFGGLGWTPHLEKLHQVVKLTVDVTADWKRKRKACLGVKAS